MTKSPATEPLRGYAFATTMVARNGRRVRFMYRELVDDDDDSGWRFFCGDEEQVYVDDPANLGLYALTTIVAIDPSIAHLLGTPAPCAFERDDERDPFRESEGFGFAAEDEP